VNRMFLKEPFYCSLHARRFNTSITGLNPVMNILRLSDKKYLNITSNAFELTKYDIPLVEIQTGIYQYKLDISNFYDYPDSYLITYKFVFNSMNLENSEIVLFERRNKAKLV
jgi:hypothetical protein